MRWEKVDGELSKSGQLEVADLQAVRDAGFKSLVCNRPDGEEAGQPSFDAISEAAERLGLKALYVPIAKGAVSQESARAFQHAVATLPQPVLAYCGSGRRVTAVAEAAGLVGANEASASQARAKASKHKVVIVGGGAGGIAVAASILARSKGLDVAIIEPADAHYYQPGWTMVGAGIFTPEETRRTMQSVMPSGVTWIKGAVASFEPDAKSLTLEDGGTVAYEKLIVAPGLKLDWDGIEGLADTLGRNGVTSNYRYDLAPYTHRLVEGLRGGKALFTQPPLPIKCAGAPQKAMYLSCDAWRTKGVLGDIDVEFLNAGPVLFGVADYVPPLMEYVKRYGIGLSFGHTLVRVDGPAKTAWFKRAGSDGTAEIVERRFDMLHVVPPQTAPDFIRSSPLAASSGWVEVDPATLRHTRYADIYGLGDAMNASNAKTAAAARKQAPTIAVNVLRDLGLSKEPTPAVYDGYGSCPLTVERGKIILAEFGYGGKRMPSFPKWLIDDLKPSRLAWYLKEQGLPRIYWQAMLKGREPMAKPRFADPVA